LHAVQLHSHLARESPKIVQELYENFEKFSKLEVLHFRKLEQQCIAPKESEAAMPAQYNRGSANNNNYDNTLKHVNIINLDGCGLPENWEKI
jgi:hypothetical protein